MRNAFSGQSKEVVELMAEVQRLMFTPANAPVHVSADKAVFFNLMFAFHNYATTVCIKGIGLDKGGWRCSLIESEVYNSTQ